MPTSVNTILTMMRFLLRLKKILTTFAPYAAGALTAFLLVTFVRYEYAGRDFSDITKLSLILTGAALLLLFCYISFGEIYGGDIANGLLNNGQFSGFKPASRYFHKGLAAMEDHDLGMAISYFKQSEENPMTDDEHAVLSNILGVCYKVSGYPTNAALYFSKAIDLGLDTAEIYLDAARCYTAAGSYDEALECYDHLSSLEPVPECVYNDIGMLWLKRGDGEKSLEYFTLSAEKHMNYSFALGGCSLACLLMKDFEKSRNYYSLAVLSGVPDISGFKEYYAEIANSVDFKADFLELNTPKNEEDEAVSPMR